MGNNREVCQAPPSEPVPIYREGGGAGFTSQRTQYYPSGLPWAEGEGQEVQNKKNNGKEFIEAHGLDEYDTQARMYYPAIMRTTTLDPLAEKYYSISPYAWCGNNPVNRIDPDGRIDIDNKAQVKYPNLTFYLKGLANDWKNKDQRFKDNFLEKSGLTEKQVSRMLEFGKGPKLEVKDLTKEKANGTTRLLKDTKTGRLTNDNNGNGLIALSINVVNMMEKATTNEDKGISVLMVESTTFHEITHVGNAIVNGNGDGKFTESGKAFEKDAYGRDVDPSNVKSIWRSLQQVQPIPISKTPILETTPIQSPFVLTY